MWRPGPTKTSNYKPQFVDLIGSDDAQPRRMIQCRHLDLKAAEFLGRGSHPLIERSKMVTDTTHGIAVWQMDGTHVAASPQIGTVNAAADWHLVG